jgi:hypothetical protein
MTRECSHRLVTGATRSADHQATMPHRHGSSGRATSLVGPEIGGLSGPWSCRAQLPVRHDRTQPEGAPPAQTLLSCPFRSIQAPRTMILGCHGGRSTRPARIHIRQRLGAKRPVQGLVLRGGSIGGSVRRCCIVSYCNSTQPLPDDHSDFSILLDSPGSVPVGAP